MSKSLNIDAAELSDVGRKRSNNQDNLARYIPEDERELNTAGALFVVADGMGGYAAGEIASTIAVQTVLSAYYEFSSENVIERLAFAIRRANEMILSNARENPEHVGMGTTLVIAVICNGILYVANIGDSRAYLIRNGKMRQVTEDHSWVGEQVRAGVLSAEQARVHIHRNVITRSLGTQPNVVADVFVEPVRQFDKILLCSDGLHGYVDEGVIEKVTVAEEPAIAVKRLIDSANNAGGPDNITVSIAHVLDTEEAPADLLEKLKLLNAQQASTQPLPILANTQLNTAILAPAPAEPITDVHSITPLKAKNTKPKSRPKSAAAIMLRIAAVLLIALISTTTWYITLGPYAQSQHTLHIVNNDIASVQSDLKSLTGYPPAKQLQILEHDRELLMNALTLPLTSVELDSLNEQMNQVVASARQALTAYNAQAHVVQLSFATSSNMPLACTSQLSGQLTLVNYPLKEPIPTSTATPAAGSTPTPTPTPPVVTPGPSDGAFYAAALNTTNQVVPLQFADGVNCPQTFTNTTAHDLQTSANSLFALTNATSTQPQTISQIDTRDGSMQVKVALTSLPKNTTALLFAMKANQIVVDAHGSAGDSLVIYSGPKYTSAPPVVLALPNTIKSMAFGGNNVLYLLFNNGSIGTYLKGISAVHIIGNLTIYPALPLGAPQNYTSATPIPVTILSGESAGISAPQYPQFSYMMGLSAQNLTLPQSILDNILANTASATPTATPNLPTPTPSPPPLTGPSTMLDSAASLAVSNTADPYIIVTDPENHRIILLKASGLDANLVQQYTDPYLLDSVSSAAFVPNQNEVMLLRDSSVIQIQLP